MDSQQGELAWPFASVPVGMHTSPPLIGRYRSIPSCNRPAFLRLVRLLTDLIIAASAMYQTKSLVTYVSSQLSQDIPLVIALCVSFISPFPINSGKGRSSDSRCRS